MTATSYLGKPTSRIDGRAKVTGAAKYAAEYNVPGLAHGFVVYIRHCQGPDQAHSIPRMRSRSTACSTCSRTSIGPSSRRRTRSIRTRSRRPARRSARSTTTNSVQRPAGGAGRRGGVRDRALRGFAGPRRVRAAGACHRLRSAARARQGLEGGDPTPARGNAAEAFEQAAVRVEAEYRMPVEHHNPMETFAATAVWEGDDRITVFDKTQGPQNCRNYVASVFGMPRDKVRVLSPYVGGAFGSGLRPQYQLPLAVLAARALKRSVRVTLTRQQMFTLGYRAANRPGAGARGRQRRQARLVPARCRRDDLAVRGFPADTSSTGRACSTDAPTASSSKGSSSSTRTRPATCARRAERKAPMRSNARWTSSPTRRTSIRSSCG